VPKVRVVGARAAALIARYEVRGGDEETRLARLVKVDVGPLERRVHMAAAVIVHYRMIVRLRRVRPRDPVGAKKVGAHRAPPAVGVLQVRVRVVDNVPIALTVNPQKRVSLRWVSEC
jgi:hypothetical protein